MKCPKCPDAEMNAATFSGIEVDRCPSCAGIWLDKGEVTKVLRKDLGLEIDAGEHHDVAKHLNHQPAHCRACDRQMVAMTGRDGVTFDYCQQCRSTFLDAGELATLQTLKNLR